MYSLISRNLFPWYMFSQLKNLAYSFDSSSPKSLLDAFGASILLLAVPGSTPVSYSAKYLYDNPMRLTEPKNYEPTNKHIPL